MPKQGQENNITKLIIPKLFLFLLCFILITFGVTQSILAESSTAGNVVSSENNPKNPVKKEAEPKKNGLAEQLVTPTGALQYKVPLNLPEGINRLAPELTLVYNSQGGNGILGMGWSLEGLPQIKRDFFYEVNYSTTDHFTYNGEKLVKNSDGYYHLQKENYERIEFNALLGYWVITGKNGTKYYFGYQAAEHSAATDGRICVAGDSGKVFLWSLSKVVDIHGNYYTVEYNEDAANGDFYAVRIAYTQNQNQTVAALRTVAFSYETRTDHYVIYNPTKVDMDHRLKYITVKLGSKLLRKWRLDYDYGLGTGSSILTGIQEYGNDGDTPPGWEVDDSYVPSGKTLPELCFEWQSKTNQSQFQFQRWATQQSGYSDAMQWFVGDFTGDGKTDLMKVWSDNIMVTADVHASTGSGFEWQRWATRQGGYSDTIQWLVGDCNGDGTTDLLKVFRENGMNSVDVYVSNGTAFESQRWATGQSGYSDTQQWFVGDFTGDGRTDLMRVWNENGMVSADVHVSTGSGFEWQRWATQQGGYSNTMKWFGGDFNGDGKTDLMKLWNQNGMATINVYISTGTGLELQVWDTNQSGYSDYMQWFVGDFNGDGKSDLMRVWNQNGMNSADVYVATGTQFQFQSWDTGQSGYCSNLTWFVGDFNGDGKTDMMKEWNSNGNLNADVHISTGAQFEYQRWATAQGGYSNTMKWFVGDFDGDGRTDLLNVWNENGMVSATAHASESSAALISSISKGDQQIIAVEYTPIAQVSAAVVPSGKSYPNIAQTNPLPLVAKIIYNDGLGNAITDTYGYYNAMVHVGQPYEQENLGFAWIEKQNAYTGSTRTYYRQDDLNLRLLVDQEELRGTDGKLYTVKQYEYQKRPVNSQAGIYFIDIANEYTYNYNGESGTPVQYRVEYDYDDYGNPQYQKNYGDTSVTGDERWIKTQYNYYIDSALYLCLPAIQTQYGVKLDGTEGTAAETRSYYDDCYNLEHQELENGAVDVVITFGYDDYGNLTSKTDGNGNTTTYVYDDDYRTFLRSETLKFTTEFSYDDLMRPVKTVDANGQVWETVYDVFSRETASVAPGDSGAAPTVQTAYPDQFLDSNGKLIFPQRKKIAKKVAAGNYLESYTYYDGFDRAVQEKTEAKEGWITVDHIYDAGGRECQTSMPYYTSSLAYSNPDGSVKGQLSKFDPIGRLVETQNPDQTSSKIIYGKYDTFTVDPLGHVTNKRVVGNVEYDLKYTGVYPSQTEYSTTAKVTTCDSVTTTDAKGKTLSVDTLDMLGRIVKSNSLLSGAWSYSYDGNNNLISRTDAKNQTITLGYNELNQITSKVYPDGTKVSYDYDESGHGYANGRLTRVGYSSGEENYTYDARGRKSAITQTIAGKSRTKQFTYNSDDKVVTETYPDGEVVTYSFDAGGQLTGLKGAAAYLTGSTYYATGKINELTFGNSVKTNYDYYDTATETDSTAGTTFSYRLKQIRVSKSTDLLNLNYQYDTAANIKVKDDSLNSKYSETYGYDDLDRLTTASSTSYGSKTFTYDTVNNITRKDGYTYKYDTDNIYRLLNDGRFSYTYDANGGIVERSDGRTLSWDYENRVKSISDGGVYTYNADGKRLGKAEGGLETYYFFDDYEETYQAGVKTKTVKYYFANKMRIAENSSVDGIRYYHQDHLSSATAITDSTGAVVLRNNYAPYGEAGASEGTAKVEYKFTDKEQDDTGLYYYGARFYDPVVGRFISVDPARDGDNWYAYCNGNPINKIDPDGKSAVGSKELGVLWGYALLEPSPVGEIVASVATVGYFGYLGYEAVKGMVAHTKTSKAKASDEIRKNATRGKNKMRPDPAANGEDHTVLKKNPTTGEVTDYTTYKKNPSHPDGCDEEKSYNGNGKPHRNKVTGKDVNTPHVHDPKAPGGVREPEPDEIPGNGGGN